MAQRYLSGVKRKTSVSAPSIICSVFWPLCVCVCVCVCVGGDPVLLRGRLAKAERYVPRKHGWNLAPGQMGILSRRGGWNVFFVGGSVMCWRGASEPVPNSPQLSLFWEMYMWCKHVGGWWKHASQTEIVNLIWRVMVVGRVGVVLEPLFAYVQSAILHCYSAGFQII